jgi:enamine deaminase RidA (YjgF/YER057c/UK114 family)
LGAGGPRTIKLCLETAGTSLRNAMKCDVYCTSAAHFAAVNAIYARYFLKELRRASSFACRNGSLRSMSRLIASR